MAIQAVATSGPVKKVPAPKPPPVTVPKSPAIGYTGSGWNYPRAGAPSNSTTVYSTTPGVAPRQITPGQPPSSIPADPALVGTVGSSSAGGTAASVPQNYGAYLDQISSDPVYQSALGNYNTNLNSWRRQLQTAIGNAVTQGGWDIRGALGADPTLQAYAGDVTPEVAAAAAANQLSSRAQLQKQLDQGLAQNAYANAARGTLGSGAQAVAATNLTDQNVVAQNTAQQTLLNALRGNVTDYLGNQTSGLNALNQTQADVAARLAALEGATYGIGDTLPADAASVNPNEPGSQVPSSVNKGGIRWGTNPQITTVAELKAQLAPGVSYAQWKANHPTAAKQLEQGF